MKQGNIYIGPTPENPEGVIGSYTDEKGMQIKGVELIDVIGQVKNQPQASSFLVRIKSPGGLVDSGNAIYDYFESLKAQGIQVDTITAGDIGSIATKIFLAGTNRTIVDGHEFFIHNPWTEMVGDSNKVALELTALKQTENELRSFYQAHTKITDAGLKGLMDAQTGMSADQAVTLGFATKKLSASKIKAFALLKPNSDMSKENFAQKLIAAIDSAFTNHKAEGVAAPAQAAASPAPTDGSASPLMGKPVMIDGQAAPDGVYTVVGGMVTAVESVEEETQEDNPGGNQQPGNPNPAAGQANALLAKIEALEQANKAQADELAKLNAIDVSAIVNEKLNEFRNSLTAGKSPRQAYNTSGQVATYTHKSISEQLAEKREERKKQLNKN